MRIRFGEPVRQFNAPLTITVQYSDYRRGRAQAGDAAPVDARGPEGPWEMMGEPVRTMSGTIEHTTTHLSEFALFGEPQVAYTHRIYLSFLMR